MTQAPDSRIQDFIAELRGFASTAESTLKTIEQDTELDRNRPLFDVFARRMMAIRGTARQLELERIAEIAGLGEEIAIKAQSATSRPQVRKCVGSLSDALTTVQYLLEHHGEATEQEEDILMNRLHATLRALGGARASFTQAEIEALLKGRKG
jgi:chemotaxis protein histidine kinase CheA